MNEPKKEKIDVESEQNVKCVCSKRVYLKTNIFNCQSVYVQARTSGWGELSITTSCL